MKVRYENQPDSIAIMNKYIPRGTTFQGCIGSYSPRLFYKADNLTIVALDLVGYSWTGVDNLVVTNYRPVDVEILVSELVGEGPDGKA
jgi:hypothetical protein